MRPSNTFWGPDYGSQISHVKSLLDRSVQELRQTQTYICQTQKSYSQNASQMTALVEQLYAVKSRTTFEAAPALPLENALNDLSISSLLSSPEPVAEKNGEARLLAANMEFHADTLSDLAFSRESLAAQIEKKILAELGLFVESYEQFQRQNMRVLDTLLHEYTSAKKTAASRASDYANKCKRLEDLSELSQLQALPFLGLTRTILRAVSRNGSDDEQEPELEQDALLGLLEFPVVLGASSFALITELQDLFQKIYENRQQTQEGGFFGRAKNTISNLELANWLRTRRPKTEGLIRNIELFGQALLSQGFLKMPVLRNSVLSAIVTPKFQATDESLEVVYDFSPLFIRVLEYTPEKVLKRSSVPDYVADLHRSGTATPVNRSRAGTISESTESPLNLGKKGISGYLTTLFKALSVMASPEATEKRKELLRSAAEAAEQAYKQAVLAVLEAQKSMESHYSAFLVAWENHEKKRVHVQINLLNYLSFLMMKQSEYEQKKLIKLNAVMLESNNVGLVAREMANFSEKGAMFFYTPPIAPKYEKNLVLSPHWVSRSLLFGTDLLLLPQYQDMSNLELYSVPVFYGEFIEKLYNVFLINYEDQYGEGKQASTQGAPNQSLLELGSFARNAWSAPFDVTQAYSIRMSVLKWYDEVQEAVWEEKQHELVLLQKNRSDFQCIVAQRLIDRIFEHYSLNGIVLALKMWLLELPESVIPFTVYDKLQALYSEEQKQGKQEKLLNVLQSIPRSNLASLHVLLSHLLKVSLMGFDSSLDDQEQHETFLMVRQQFLTRLARPEGHGELTMGHVILRPSSKHVARALPEVADFYEQLVQDLVNDGVLMRLGDLVVERETAQQKILKIKQKKEQEGLHQYHSANSSPSLSRLNVKAFDSEKEHVRQSSSGGSVTSEGSTPTVMVEGLALRSFGTKRRIERADGGGLAVNIPTIVTPEGDADEAVKDRRRQHRRSFSLLNEVKVMNHSEENPV